MISKEDIASELDYLTITTTANQGLVDQFIGKPHQLTEVKNTGREYQTAENDKCVPNNFFR